ncbi:FAD-linked oxidase C-terminal domain-containing protein [Roseibacterium sp. SDUM158017]|uniref:FAD-binding oxidoreductase n=1 Tax=Roseicyclus salinarum TaxID=3036773 RepID=UPI0024158A01|nr:FAD-linked oxidase C-terminal domain-containing protein [Roseibacterium sp. SDUM158017]MDG4647608.1 FAD-linked oxidase C-terminal domain-containing protein [Roseibacterium sp. SDUM158017]
MALIADLPRNEDGIATALDLLRQRFGPDRVETGRTLREQHAHTTTWLRTQPPDAVVFPTTTEEVQAVVGICAAHRVPIVPFGTGSSLEGHVNAPAGGVSLDFSRMDRILAVHPEDMDVVVEPGVTRKALKTHLRDTGLFFPVDPGADASLGGMAATRASGTNAVRYGTMKDNVLALKAVLPSGEVLKTGARARKSSAGYDLTRLMVGSEGTLGIITELTLKLQGIPEAISAATCSFGSVGDACAAVIETIQYGLPVARIELLDSLTVKAVNAYSKLDLPEAPLLLLEFHGTGAGVAEQAEAFGDIAAGFGGEGFVFSTREEERGRLWQARHDAFWASLALRPGAKGISTDVCVPVSRLADCVVAAQEKTAEMGFVAPVVGHVGDGNFHVLLLIDIGDAQEVARAEHFVGWLNELAISMDGTCTGEHGIGQGKAAYLEAELGPAAMEVMAAIKRGIDPGNILNPGKLRLPA